MRDKLRFPHGGSMVPPLAYEALEPQPVNPPNDAADEHRLAALNAYDILDTPPEPGFDEVVHIARVLCDAPVALVSFVAEDRQWFKARAGFEPCQTDLRSSVCAYALTEPDLLVIPDLTLDHRTRANPLVMGEPHIRFYAGAPLRTGDGHVLGSLCVIDGEPRPAGLAPKQASALRNLAAQVIAQMELRRALAQRDRLIAASREADGRCHALLRLGDWLRDASTETELIHAACEIVGEALGVSRAGFGHLDADALHVEVVSDWTKQGVASVVGRHRIEDYGALAPDLAGAEPLVVADVRADPRTAADPARLLDLGVASQAIVTVRERGRAVALLFVHDDAPRAWTPEVLAFLRNVADRIEVGVGRLRAESDQRVLNLELSHRMKNMMTMAQAIVSQTLRGVQDRRPVDALIQRLVALASAHDMLLEQTWSSASIRAITMAALDRFGVAGRFDMAGPDMDLGPRATLSLSMLLHEMTTNAMKYGALSAEAGRVSLAWRLDETDGGPDLVIDWRESGGPEIEAPKGRSFGTRLITMGLVGRGGVTLRYPPSGLEAEFRAPLGQAQGD